MNVDGRSVKKSRYILPNYDNSFNNCIHMRNMTWVFPFDVVFSYVTSISMYLHFISEGLLFTCATQAQNSIMTFVENALKIVKNWWYGIETRRKMCTISQ